MTAGIIISRIMRFGSRRYLGTAPGVRRYGPGGDGGTLILPGHLRLREAAVRQRLPFCDPVYEKEKILELGLPEVTNQAIFAGNWLRLLGARPGEPPAG